MFTNFFFFHAAIVGATRPSSGFVIDSRITSSSGNGPQNRFEHNFAKIIVSTLSSSSTFSGPRDGPGPMPPISVANQGSNRGPPVDK